MTPSRLIRTGGKITRAGHADKCVTCVADTAGDMVHAVISPPRPWRRAAVAASFLAAIVLVIVLNRRGQRAGGDPALPKFHFTDVTAQVGINFVHHGPTLDPKLDNIAPLVGALGASVSVADVNNDGRSEERRVGTEWRTREAR